MSSGSNKRPRSRAGRGGSSNQSRRTKNASDNYNSASLASRKKFRDEDPASGSDVDRKLLHSLNNNRRDINMNGQNSSRVSRGREIVKEPSSD